MDASPLKFLAIIPDRNDLEALRAALTDALPGCVPLTATDGPRGIAPDRDEDPDAIVLERFMPDTAGVDACRRLGAEERPPDTPAILPANRGQRLEKEAPAGLVAQRTREPEQELAECKRAERALETEREALRASMAQSDRLATMGMLAAGVAHEINNPLTYVLYNIESVLDDLPKLAESLSGCHAEAAVRRGADDVAAARADDPHRFNPPSFEDAIGLLRGALDGMERIKQIARSLGTFSRVESTKVSPVDVRRAAEHAIAMAFNEIKYRARLVKDFTAVSPVLASEGKLAQVFLNLLINAAHSIDEGHVERNEIRVRTFTSDDQVCIEVSDTGKGIAPEHQGRIFEPFFTTKNAGVGSGLGLSICKNIVTDCGGEIRIASEPGKGTRVLITLPPMPSDSRVPRPAFPDPAPDPPRMRGRILIVDDEAGIRGMVARMLEGEHEVLAVASGEEAQLLLEKDRRFDLVFCDLMMPRLSGMELHAWLALRDPILSEQVVFMTGGAFTPAASQYLADVKNLRLEKPFDTASLRRLAGEFVLAARSKRKC